MLHILKNKTFLLFFIGNITSLIGFGLNMIAVSWLVLEKTGSEIALGKVLAISTAPGVLLALLAGNIIDRTNRKWLMILLDIFRLIVIVIFIYLININGFTIRILYPIAMLIGLGNSLFWPTAQAFVQEIVNDKDYFPANALLSASYQVGSILGAGVGGFIVHIYSPITALYFNAIAYAVSAIFISLAPFKKSDFSSTAEKFLLSIKKGFTFLRLEKNILILGLTTIISDVAVWGSLSVLTISISKVIFNKGSWGYGLLDGFYGFGALLSTILIATLVKKYGRKKSLILCYMIAGFSCLISPLLGSIYFAAISYFFMGLNNNTARIIIRTIFMENIPNNIMGRVQIIFGVYTKIMIVVSTLLAGIISEKVNINTGVFFTSLHFVIALLGVITVYYYQKESKKLFKHRY